MRTVRARALVVAAALAAGLVGAGTSHGVPGVGTAAPAAAPQAPALEAAGDCSEQTPAPSSSLTGRKVQEIKNRGANGTLVVGVDQNSYNWGFRNPQSGQLEGFDILLSRAIAKAVLGDANRVTFRTVTTAKRIEAIRNGTVDMVVRTMTINCERRKDIAFSAPYFSTGQRLVVPKSDKSTTVAEALKGKRACAAQQSSSETELKKPGYGTSSVTIVENQLDCLVLMQLGKVDGTLTDSSLAAAQAAQDPAVRLVDENIIPAKIGIGLKQEDTDLTALVNQILLDYRANGGWQAAYDRWLAPSMGANSAPYLP
ncbi:polar amino acid transport system substrate-binding protein [Kitasatospora gansuensis]|uniref:Polar amino acid transport system substrate-binding protein n=1 Tax=Kitasatospora gansuensis TaxID=258050 RepID=A0A7W7S9L7_9ACTN|nr:glutamate ABC transporter substrate-binding protein [Kitasatospora gansuensis]MBB4946444.1 polar amino acid transport system substrate-binding protein [Kitasatospora gansuensis]